MKLTIPLALFVLACPVFAQADSTSPVTTTQVVAQAPASAPAVAAADTAPVPAVPAVAAPEAPPTGPNSSGALLTIPIPANARITMELDTHGDDILGVVKDFLAGYDAQTVVDSITSAQQLEPQIRAAMDGTWNPKAPATQPAKAHVETTILPDSVAHLSMADVLHNINHLHMVVLEVPETQAAATTAKPTKPKPVAGAAPLLPGEAASTPGSTAIALKNMVKYYETTYHSEGGNRIFFADLDYTKMIMIGFHDTRSSAMVFQLPGSVVVMRIDGYIDLKPLNQIISAAMHQVVKTAR